LFLDLLVWRISFEDAFGYVRINAIQQTSKCVVLVQEFTPKCFCVGTHDGTEQNQKTYTYTRMKQNRYTKTKQKTTKKRIEQNNKQTHITIHE